MLAPVMLIEVITLTTLSGVYSYSPGEVSVGFVLPVYFLFRIAFVFGIILVAPIILMLLFVLLLLRRFGNFDERALDIWATNLSVSRFPMVDWQRLPKETVKVEDYFLWECRYKRQGRLINYIVNKSLQHSTLYPRGDIVRDICDLILGDKTPRIGVSVLSTSNKDGTTPDLVDRFFGFYTLANTSSEHDSVAEIANRKPMLVHIFSWDDPVCRMQQIALRDCKAEIYRRGFVIYEIDVDFAGRPVWLLRGNRRMIIAFKDGQELSRIDGITATWAIEEFVRTLCAPQANGPSHDFQLADRD
jgi:hypothetical protein